MTGLTRKLGGIDSKSEKRKTIQQYFRNCEEEKNYFAGLYPHFVEELERTGNVTQAVHNLRGSGHTFVTNISDFSKEFQIACVAARKPLQTPTEFIKKTGTRRTRRNPNEKGKKTPAIFDRYNSNTTNGYKQGKSPPADHGR
jgi:hypothetical protein